MVKGFIKKTLEKFGFKITRLPKPKAENSSHKSIIQKSVNKELYESLVADPTNGILHVKLANNAFDNNNFFLSYAELKTAETLGTTSEDLKKKILDVRKSIPELKFMNHNTYFRLACLASEILNRAGTSNISILDVGGGNGALASFLPDSSYCLAEPTVNGISGTKLPFPDHSFDYVVSCHVLEHIPVDERTTFLDQLVSKAKYGVLLLNPFYVEGTDVEKRLELVIRLTNSQWAKEHLDCTLPKVEDVESYANSNNLDISIKPNGTMTTSLAFVFIDYFSSEAKLKNSSKDINYFFNKNYMNILDSEKYPNGYLVYLGLPKNKMDSQTGATRFPQGNRRGF